MNWKKYFSLAFIMVQFLFLELKANDFIFFNKNTKATILYDKYAPKIDSITAHLLARDIESVTGYLPPVLTDVFSAKGNVIVIGNVESSLIKKFTSKSSATSKKIIGKWECYVLQIVDHPLKDIEETLIITGSDNRGTAYGVFDISQKIGVSPWYWWADVTPKKQDQLSIKINDFSSSPPSVKYRGIFLNDEDWGLQPWAAKTFEPEANDIGPKTYAKIFELLLRLKANLIWPAMHPSTKAFFSHASDKEMAAAYSIIIGSSHAEPMLRNNVGEWNEKTMGAFNYITNKQKVYNYWEERVKEAAANEAVYTIGMRGVHDSGIEGVKSNDEAVPLLQNIFIDQRNLLAKYIHKKIEDIPQAFTAYKEVLEIYDNGLKIPNDVTLVWPDDNYGYIQRLNNEQESMRTGGSGVYYHASYWGRPHDYLWLSTTHPGLIREEMMKAFQNKSNKLWVLNVGDLKPCEYNIQLFLDMAYKAASFEESNYTKQHLLDWVKNIFGEENASAIANVLWQYYQLAFERKPEFMGWSQTEPTTKTNYTTYNHFYFGDEAQKRINVYNVLENEVRNLKNKIDPQLADAFYELVYYPVVCAALINKKFLYRDKAFLYARQNRLSAYDYASASKAAYDSIVTETEFYNNQLAKGKWKNIMSMQPRDLPVYQAPVLNKISIDSSLVWSIAPEGFVNDSVQNNKPLKLPEFNSLTRSKYFVDVFLTANKIVKWTASTSQNWIKISQRSGTLSFNQNQKEIRVWVEVDWSKASGSRYMQGEIIFKSETRSIPVAIILHNYSSAEITGYKGFTENNGYVSIFASHFSRQKTPDNAYWKTINNFGHTGNCVEAFPFTIKLLDTINFSSSPHLEYDFFTTTPANPQINIYTLPTQPLNNNYGMRYAVSVDDNKPVIMNFKTVGRSEEWKQNVLSNEAVRRITMPFLQKGKHVLKIYMIDPGVILDRFTINLGGLKNNYGVIPETKIDNN